MAERGDHVANRIRGGGIGGVTIYGSSLIEKQRGQTGSSMRGYSEDEEVQSIEIFGRTLKVEVWIRQVRSINSRGLPSPPPTLPLRSIWYGLQQTNGLFVKLT